MNILPKDFPTLLAGFVTVACLFCYLHTGNQLMLTLVQGFFGFSVGRAFPAQGTSEDNTKTS